MAPATSRNAVGNAKVLGQKVAPPAKDIPAEGLWYLPPAIPNAFGTQTILYAEDDDDLRVVMQVFLEVAGYLVIPAANAEEASKAFRSGAAVDLLITDIEMPGRSGLELARELTTILPSLPVLVVSGTLISGEMEREMRTRDWRYHSKPCSFQALILTIHALLQTIGLSI